MRTQYRAALLSSRRMTLAGMVLVLLVCCGCPISQQEPGDGSGLPVYDSSSNSTFDQATALSLPASDELDFQASINRAGDLDLFNLGQVNPGDRIYVDVQPDDPNLDLVAAVFNANQELQDYNDDRIPDSSDLNPLLDFVLRDTAGTYYLGIAPFAGTQNTGAYHVSVRITRGVGVPSPHAQVVYLNWAGGNNILVKNVGIFDLPPFDATDVGPYEGRTAEMKTRVQQIVAVRYAGYDLVLRNSDTSPVPTEPHSTIYFGGRSQLAFAISEQIDSYNEDESDNTIIFTESYRDTFVFTPTFEQMATALGDTVAHEVGHLLGLVHTADCNDLMDTTCANERLLSPQEFTTAVLDDSVFPIGVQPEDDILAWVLGLVGS